MLLNPYLYHQALSINTNTNNKNDFKYLIPKNTIQTLSINRFTPIHDIQEEKKDIPEIKNISLKKIDDSNEMNSFDQELNEIKKEFFSELPDEEKDDILDFENQFIIQPSDQDQDQYIIDQLNINVYLFVLFMFVGFYLGNLFKIGNN